MNLEYNLIFLSEAELELKWIIIRYNVHSEGLGNKVFDEVQKNLDYLKSMLLYVLKNTKTVEYYTLKDIK